MPIQAATGFSRREGSFRAGQDAASMASRQLGAPSLIFLCSSVSRDHQQVLQGVRSIFSTTPIVGGSSFGEMTEGGFRDESVSLMALSMPNTEVSLGLGLETDVDPFRAGRTAARLAAEGMNLRDAPGLLGLLLSEMRANEQPLLGTQTVLGVDFPLFGGCCSGNRNAPIADPAFSQGYQYHHEQIHRHAASLALLAGDFHVAFGVAHGWQPMGMEVTVGRTEGSVVQEIDGEPALRFYARFLGDGQPTAFPLGFLKEGHLILRAARGVADSGSLEFTAPLPEGCKVRITRGSRADILRSSEAATQFALDAMGRDRLRAALLVSCISRRTMLGTRVGEEVEVVRRVLGEGVPLIGFYAAGEFAPPGHQSLYHNCTFCLCLLGEREAASLGRDPRPIQNQNSQNSALAGQVENRTDLEEYEERLRRLLIVTEREDLAAACQQALQNLSDQVEWRRDWTTAQSSLETEYAQVLVLEQRHAVRIPELVARNAAIQVVVLIDAQDPNAPDALPPGVVGSHGFAGTCRLPLVPAEIQFLTARALEQSRLRVAQRLAERQLQQALRGLKNAENAVETSEKMLTESYRTIERANRDMRIVLDNVQQGFVTLNRDGVMAHGRSKAIDSLLGEWMGPIEFSKYLARCSPPLGQLFGLAWEQVVAGFLPLEVTLELLPKQWVVGPRHLRFEHIPIQPKEGDPEWVEGLVVVVTDATAEVRKREAEAEQQEAIEMFKRILRDPNGVEQFARNASEMVQKLTQGEASTSEDPASIRRVLHTLKGNCAMMGLHRVAAVCHTLEDDLVTHGQVQLSDSQRASLRDVWASVDQLIQSFCSQRRDEVSVSRETIRNLSEKAARGAPTAELSQEIRTLLHEPVRQRLERLAENARVFAQRLQRGPIEVRVQADDLRLEPRKWAPLWSELVHLVRNAVDHGVAPESKRAVDQPAPAIRLEARSEGSSFRVSVVDNGPGIDWERVAEQACRLGMPHATREELTAALFADKFSTRDRVTDTSGRGVGLAAVRQMVTELSGTIEVRSEPGTGATFSLRFARA